MATKVSLSVTLTPVDRPWVRISVGDYKKHINLTDTTRFDIDFETESLAQVLLIEHVEKHHNDPTTAVIVDSIGFFAITDPKFVWAGVYYPEYPGHYPDKTSPLLGHNYLSWNGTYRLDFDVPVFTWMHKILDFGQIYQ
jgi:hypothetical protein